MNSGSGIGAGPGLTWKSLPRRRAIKAWSRGRLPLVLAVAVGALLAGCSTAGTSQGSYPIDFFTEMHYHQSYKIQEPPSLSEPSEAVPTTGREVSYTLEEARALENPLPRNEVTLALGARVFETNCAVCHGASGLGVDERGDGTMRGKLRDILSASGHSPADLTATGPTAAKPDGEVYLIITKGFGETYFSGRPSLARTFVMPPFAKLLTLEERWAVMHHIRSLQGK